MRKIITILITGSVLPVQGASADSELIREQQRQQQFQQQMQPEVDVRLESEPSDPANQPPRTLSQQEAQCFPISQIKLIGKQSERFKPALNTALKKVHFKPGLCIGIQGIDILLQQTQTQLIEQGFITSRVHLPEGQNLRTGQLNLIAIPGRIQRIHYENGRYLFNNALTLHNGAILNIRDIEQSLENLKRLPTVDADIQIAPATQQDQTDIIITTSQRFIPARLAFTLDDSGSHTTGRYQGGVTLSLDNPTGLSDLFYVNYNHDLGGKKSETDPDGNRTESGTKGYAVHYSLPWGHWLWSINRSHYRYHQAVAGFSENYDYNGKSDNTDIGFTRQLYRANRQKSSIGFKVWHRESHNFINDAEIDIQERRTSGWLMNIDHREYLGASTLDLGISYKRGTGAHSLPAPEEAFNEGTSRMKIITADINLFTPFTLTQRNFSFNSAWHSQWNKTALITQDQLSIGGRYTVRGFDGELSLMSQRGWYTQNTLAWHYLPQHQFYLGGDVGHLAANPVSPQLGQTLAGSVIGIKGAFNAGGVLTYDLFAGTPLYKPAHFNTDDITGGFALTYTF